MVMWRPGLALPLLAAALPFLNFAPWTGGLVFEEFDLLVLAVAAGGFARLAVDSQSSTGSVFEPVCPSVAFVSAAWIFGLASLVSLVRGLVASGGEVPLSWFQNETDPLNAWRVFKSVLGVALTWPIVRERILRDPAAAIEGFANGMVIGVTIVSLAVIQERGAYPGLFNLSSSYRVTALFWEMHVGGAAIDAYFAMAIPFVAYGLRSASTRWRWGAVAVVALLTTYAGLTTFARGLYLAAGVSLTLLSGGLASRREHAERGAARDMPLFLAFALGLPGFAAVLVAVLLWLGKAGVVLLAVCVAGIGGIAILGFRPSRRGVATLVLALAVTMEIVGVLAGSAFVHARIIAGQGDLESRLVHWRQALGLLDSPSRLFWGIGLGRMPLEFSAHVPAAEFPGSVRWLGPTEGTDSVLLSGPRTQMNPRGWLALTQRVQFDSAAWHLLDLELNAKQPVVIVARLCETHLLFARRCQQTRVSSAQLPPGVGNWQPVGLVLRGRPLGSGPWPWRRAAILSVAVVSAGGNAEVRNLHLHAAGGPDLVVNGDFSGGLAHWLPVAHGFFVPWHVDNLYLELAIERGWPATLAFCIGAGVALMRLLGKPGQANAAAPYLAAALCGLLCVGMVSNVMDAPWVAYLGLLLMVLSIELTSKCGGSSGPRDIYSSAQ